MDKNGKVTNGPYWTQNWIEAMWRFTSERFVNFDTGAVDFEALGREEYEFRKALFFRNFKNSPRAKKVFDEADGEYKKKVENGSKGGRPRKNPEENTAETADLDSQGRTGAPSTGATSSTAPVRSLPMPTTEQLYDFARAESLDEADARDWYEMTVVDRGGKDRNGKPIGNWKGALKRFCATKTANRSNA